MSVDGAPSRLARVCCYGFLAAFLGCAALGVECWPLTGFELFSRVRTGVVAGWQVTTVDHAGAERPLDFAALPRGYRGWFQTAGRLSAMGEARRDAVLRDWARAARAHGVDVASVRVYRTAEPVRTDYRRPPPPATRTLRYQLDVP